LTGLELGLSVSYTEAEDSQTLSVNGTDFMTSGQQINPYATPRTVVPSLSYSFPVGAGYEFAAGWHSAGLLPSRIHASQRMRAFARACSREQRRRYVRSINLREREH
jgi:hypothetical protein